MQLLLRKVIPQRGEHHRRSNYGCHHSNDEHLSYVEERKHPSAYKVCKQRPNGPSGNEYRLPFVLIGLVDQLG